MEQVISTLLSKLLSYGGWGIALLIIFLLVLYPERVQIISSYIYKAFGFAGTFFQKRAVSNDIEGRFNLAAKKINQETPGLMPYNVAIKWVSPRDVAAESFLKEGTIVVRIGYYRNEDKNLVNVTHHLVQQHHLNDVKSYIDECLKTSLNLALTKRYLSLSESRAALQLFVEEILLKELSGNPAVSETYRKIEALDDLGFFTRIMLVEFTKMAKSLYPQKVGLPQILEETRRFVDFLDQFPNRAPGEEIELCFAGGYLKIAIVLVARSETLKAGGYEPYLRRIENYLTGKCDAVYVCALDGLRQHARNVGITAFKSLGVRISSEQNYEAVFREKKRLAVCLRLERPQV